MPSSMPSPSVSFFVGSVPRKVSSPRPRPSWSASFVSASSSQMMLVFPGGTFSKKCDTTIVQAGQASPSRTIDMAPTPVIVVVGDRVRGVPAHDEQLGVVPRPLPLGRRDMTTHAERQRDGIGRPAELRRRRDEGASTEEGVPVMVHVPPLPTA